MKKLLLTLIVGMLCISMVSAGMFDFNKKSFNPDVGKYGKVTIDDWWGLGKQVELELTENTEVCEEKCEAKIPEFIMYEKGILIEDIRFIGDQPDSYQIYVNDKPYQIGTEVNKGTYDVRIEGKLGILKETDWQIKVGGYWIEEYAVWTSNFNDGLRGYWKMDEISGSSAEDELGLNDGTLTNITFNPASGLINGAGNGSGNNPTLNLTYRPAATDTAITFNFWMNISNLDSFQTMCFKGGYDCGTPNSNGDFRAYFGGSVLQSDWYDGAARKQADTPAINTGTWQMITFVINQTAITGYTNGTAGTPVAATTFTWTGTDTFFPWNVLGEWTTNTFIDEIGIWNRSLTSTEITDLYNGGAGISYGVGFVNVELDSPANNLETRNSTIEFIGNFTFIEGNFTNYTLQIWDPANNLYATNFSEITGTTNGSINSMENLAINDSYLWNYYVCGLNSSLDALCDGSIQNRTFNISSYTYNSETFNTSSIELKKENFILNISVNPTTTIDSVMLSYNGTNYSGTNIGTSTAQLWKATTTNIANVLGNKTFNWAITSSGGTKTTNLRGQVVNHTILSICNSTLIYPYINFTFQNETVSQEKVNATIDASTWTYWIDDVNTNKSYSFSNSTEHAEYNFCAIQPYQSLNVKYELKYNNAISQQRTTNQQFLLSNVTTNKTLLLLPTSDGIFVTFQVVSASGQVQSGVNATVKKGGVDIVQGFTDDAGVVVFFLDPDTSYALTFDKAGLTSYATTIITSQSSYTITMGSTSTTTVPEDYTKGIVMSFEPTKSYVNNQTVNSFNFTISSSFWTIDEYGFNLTNGTDLFSSTSAATNGGTLNINLDSGNNKTIVLTAFYTIDQNKTIIGKSWTVFITGDTSFSILHFFTDLKTYTSAGIFGIDDFGIAIITFLTVFLFTGVLTFKFGLRSPETLLGLIFALVMFLDVGVGIMPNPVGAITHFPTIFIAIIIIGIYVRGIER